jgi:hypothetical protein
MTWECQVQSVLLRQQEDRPHGAKASSLHACTQVLIGHSFGLLRGIEEEQWCNSATRIEKWPER